MATTRKTLVGIAALLLTTPLHATSAQAAPGATTPLPTVVCGVVLNQDALLDRDLDCSGADPIRLRDGADLDLGWHSLSGSARAGVVVDGEGSVVRNGTVAGYHYGVFVGDGVYEDDEGDGVPRSATIRRVTFTGNEYGVRGVASPVSVVASTFRDNTVGVETAGGGALTISTSRLSGSQVAVSGFGPVKIGATTVQENQVGLECGFSTFSTADVVWSGNATAIAHDHCGGSSVTYDHFLGNDTNLGDWGGGGGGDADAPVVRCSVFRGGTAPELPVHPCGFPVRR